MAILGPGACCFLTYVRIRCCPPAKIMTIRMKSGIGQLGETKPPMEVVILIIDVSTMIAPIKHNTQFAIQTQFNDILEGTRSTRLKACSCAFSVHRYYIF
jgi:hypothetical protein